MSYDRNGMALLPPSARGADPHAPLLTYYDDATGERTELSGVELGGWAARTANLLVRECGLRPGDSIAVLLPPHWQTAAILLGAWSAGVSVQVRPWGPAGLATAGNGADVPVGALFVSRYRAESWLEDVPAAPHRFVLGLAPGDTPSPGVPEGYRDYLVAVRRHDCAFRRQAGVRGSDAATVDGTSFDQWGAVAQAIAASRGIEAGDRVLIDAAASEEPVNWLLAPLSAGASMVLCANLDRGAVPDRVAAEGVTRVL